MIKPILVPTNKSYLYLHESKLYNNRFTQHIPDGKQQPIDVILIDIEAEIVKGDTIYNSREALIEKINSKEDLEFINSINTNDELIIFKIISSTNKSYELPQLSQESIQLLIKYYNEHKYMPESVDIKEEFKYSNTGKRDDGIGKYVIKLNEKGEIDITIPEKPLHQQIIDSCGGEEAFCRAAGITTPKVENNIQKDIQHVCNWYQGRDVACCERVEKLSKEKLYTEKEIYELFNSFKKDFPLHRGIQIMDCDLKEWFETNKK